MSAGEKNETPDKGKASGRAGFPPADVVERELSRLLADPDFVANEARRNMLAFVVRETLAGRGNRLKGAVLAQEVFGRGADFDPQVDPVVRIEARRLRRDLDSYYASHGDQVDLRFDIPKGAYVVAFTSSQGAAHTHETGPSQNAGSQRSTDVEIPATRPRYRVIATGGAVLSLVAVAIMAVWIALNLSEQKADAKDSITMPGLAIAPFQALSVSPEDGFLARGLSDQLANDLMPFDGFITYLLPSGRANLSEGNLDALALDYAIDYIVTGSLGTKADTADIHLIVQLRGVDGRLVWSDEFLRQGNARDLIALRRDLSSAIATELGQTYGIIASDLRNQSDDLVAPSDGTFACLLQAHEYRRTFQAALRASTRECLEAAIQRDPDNAEAWAMAGWVRLDTSLFAQMGADERLTLRAQAVEATRHAMSLAPQNVTSLQAHAAALHYSGSYDEAARTIRAAHDLRPDDPEILHQMGWRLAIRGHVKEGAAYIRAAVERSVDPPRRYYNFIALDYYLQQRYSEMLASAQLSAQGGSPIGNALLAIANTKAAEGTPEGTALALANLQQSNSGFAKDPAAMLRVHGATDEIVDIFVSGLTEAGWTGPEMN